MPQASGEKMHDVEVLVHAEKTDGKWHVKLSGSSYVNSAGDIDLSKIKEPVQLHFHLLSPDVRFRNRASTHHGLGAISIRKDTDQSRHADDAAAHFDEDSRRTFAHVELAESSKVADASPGHDRLLRVHNNKKGAGRFNYNLYFETVNGNEAFMLDPWIINS